MADRLSVSDRPGPKVIKLLFMVSAVYLIQLISILRKHLVIGQLSLFSFSLLFIGLMTPVYFVKTTESCEVCQ